LEEQKQLGEVVTFYSYKGGVGRTMALANVGCLLAEGISNQPSDVLLIDWDLEAPGLHRFFESYSSFDPSVQPGMVEFMAEILERLKHAPEEKEESAASVIESCSVEKYVVRTSVPRVSIMTAGAQDSTYAARVRALDWRSAYLRTPWMMRVLADYLRERFRYILIDSRTGLADASGVATTLLPDKLVLAFTPNKQSVEGAVELANRALTYRKSSSDLRSLMVYPLPSRIENAEPELHRKWRRGDKKTNWPGYQHAFEECFKSAYGLSECSLEEYFNQVQIQYTPTYAYGEAIAARIEDAKDRLSLSRSYLNFAERLSLLTAPWEETSTSVASDGAYEDSAQTAAEATKLLRAKDTLGWKQFTRDARRNVVSSLLRWLEHVRSEGVDPWIPKLTEAVRITSPLHVITLTAIDAEMVTTRDIVDAMRDIVEVQGWPSSGLTVLVNAPYSLGYVYHSIVGASLLQANHQKLAMDLLCSEVGEDRYEGTRGEIRNNHQLIGHGESMGRHAGRSWEYLSEGWQNWNWLRASFVRQNDYQRSLRAYWFLASLLELCERTASGEFSDGAPQGVMRLTIPPTFLMIEDPVHTLRQLVQAVVPNRHALTMCAERMNADVNEVRNAWPIWCRGFSEWYRQSTPFLAHRLNSAGDRIPNLP
jgi:MinD-like ATPase involved in chromosome partitioning or flagellar assembly